MNSSGSALSTAWPHAARGHILQVGTGYFPGSSCTDEVALKLLQESASEIAPDSMEGDYFPNLVEDFMDVSKVCSQVSSSIFWIENSLIL